MMIVACFVPWIEGSQIVPVRNVPIKLWGPIAIQPLIASILAVVVASVLMSRPRNVGFLAGLTAGVGAQSMAFFLTLVARQQLSGAPGFKPGGAIGLAGAALVLAGGFVSARAPKTIASRVEP